MYILHNRGVAAEDGPEVNCDSVKVVLQAALAFFGRPQCFCFLLAESVPLYLEVRESNGLRTSAQAFEHYAGRGESAV